MELIIKILNGERAGTILRLGLPTNSSIEDNIPFVLENESIEVQFISDVSSDILKLKIFEMSIDYTERVTLQNNQYQYIWRPKYINQSLFYNYFGLTTIGIVIPNSDDYFDQEYFFEPLEVYTEKANAKRIKEMVTFLVKENNHDVFNFARLTQTYFGLKEGATSPNLLLDKIDNLVTYLEKILPSFQYKKLYCLVQKEDYIDFAYNYAVDDNTISWVTRNLDKIYEVDKYSDLALFEFNGKYYSIDSLNTSVAVKDYNIYENRIIFGFLDHLILTINKVLSGFKIIKEDSKKRDRNGYISFISYLKQHSYELNSASIDKFNRLKKKIISFKYELEKNLIGVDSLQVSPLVTPKVKSNLSYFQLFQQIISWYKYGTVDWSQYQFLFSLNNASKLFELYCLFRLNRSLNEVLDIQSKPYYQGLDMKGFRYKYQDYIINLFYEPKFWMVGHKQSNVDCLMNIEGLSFYDNSISKRSRNHHFSHRSPDFTISVTKNNKTLNFIMDAKYMHTSKMMAQELPKLVLKYLHGLYNENHEILGLMLLNYGNDEHFLDFHCEEFGFYKNNDIQSILGITLSGEDSSSGQNENILPKVLSNILLKGMGLAADAKVTTDKIKLA